MPNNNIATAFSEAWALVNEGFYGLDHLRTLNLGFAEHFLSDTQIQNFLAQNQIAEIQSTRPAGPGLNPKIPFINKEVVDTSVIETIDLCAVDAESGQITSQKQFHTIGAIKISTIIDDQEFLKNAVDLASSLAARFTDHINDAWDRMDVAMQGVVEANKNQYWTGLKLPTGWAIVGDAIQVPYADINLLAHWLPIIFKQLNMNKGLNIELDPILMGLLVQASNQGAGNNVNTAFQFAKNLSFKESNNMPETPPGVSHVLYASQKATRATFGRVPDAFRSSINKNIEGKFDIADKINGLPISIGDLPFDFGMKTQIACNAEKYHKQAIGGAGTGKIKGQPERHDVYLTEYYGIIQPVSDPASIARPTIRVEILDAY